MKIKFIDFHITIHKMKNIIKCSRLSIEMKYSTYKVILSKITFFEILCYHYSEFSTLAFEKRL